MDMDIAGYVCEKVRERALKAAVEETRYELTRGKSEFVVYIRHQWAFQGQMSECAAWRSELLKRLSEDKLCKQRIATRRLRIFDFSSSSGRLHSCARIEVRRII